MDTYTLHASRRRLLVALLVILLLCPFITYGARPAKADPDRLLALAQKAANAGDYSASSRIYRRALQAGADSLACFQAMADNAMLQGDYTTVLRLCPQIRQMDMCAPYTYNY